MVSRKTPGRGVQDGLSAPLKPGPQWPTVQGAARGARQGARSAFRHYWESPSNQYRQNLMGVHMLASGEANCSPHPAKYGHPPTTEGPGIPGSARLAGEAAPWPENRLRPLSDATRPGRRSGPDLREGSEGTRGVRCCAGTWSPGRLGEGALQGSRGQSPAAAGARAADTPPGSARTRERWTGPKGLEPARGGRCGGSPERWARCVEQVLVTVGQVPCRVPGTS
jgi:hypothetical protein